MPDVITAPQLFSDAGVACEGSVPWGSRVPCDRPGVYVVEGAEPGAPMFSRSAIEQWLHDVPDLRLRGVRPTTDQLEQELARFWWPQARVLYVGMSTRLVGARVAEFARHRLGGKGPHRGGHWLKTLAPEILAPALIHFAAPAHPALGVLESRLLAAFAERVRPARDTSEVVASLDVMPFANLRAASGARKAHGLSGQTR